MHKPHQLDNSYWIDTPEGVPLALQPAGIVVRVLAWSIDFSLRLGLFWLVVMATQFLGWYSISWGVTLLSAFLLEWWYPVLFEVYWRGATPGKRILGLRVVQENGSPVDWGRSLLRNLLRTADFFPMMYSAGLICMLLRQDCRRLGDLAAGTLVVYTTQPVVRTTLPEAFRRIAPQTTLSAEEQGLLLNLAERSTTLNSERVEELLELLDPKLSLAQFQALSAYLQGQND